MKKLVLTGVLSVGTLMGPNLFGLEVITVNAASFSAIESNIEKQNSDFIIGPVIDVGIDYVGVEFKNIDGKTDTVEVILPQGHLFKEGDKVKVTNRGQWTFMNGFAFAAADSISKINEKQTEDFVIGPVIDVGIDYVGVEFKNIDGKTDTVEVVLPQGHLFKEGDKVKVTNRGQWTFTNGFAFAAADSISKITKESK
ncbi:hypothetical protein IIO_04956 [Bacillus cereus VD115]|nr:hypothetical protein IIO_04956 [Bacillus cereus VD115]